MVSVDEALQLMLDAVATLGMEKVPLLDAWGRIVYHDIISDINIPPLSNSAMDGYAVRSTDVALSSQELPVLLPVIAEIKAGDAPEPALSEKTAIRIMTGAPVPPNCDSVVPVEYTEESGGKVRIYQPVKKDENIRFAGEDIAAGKKVLGRGDIIKSADIGILASLNIQEIELYRQPHVAVLSTGDEIVELGQPLAKGQIRNSNAYTLLSELKKYHAIPHYLGIAKDTVSETRKKILEALQYNIIITTGGVSMGKYDFVKEVLVDLGIDILTEKIRMKPGKPLIFGRKGTTLFFGLPGNPVSAMISFIEFVRPVILRMMGSTATEKPLVKARLMHNIRKKPERKHFIRGYFSINDGQFQVATTGPQGSGILSSMSKANCLIIVPENVESVHADDWVTIQLIDHEEI